MRNFDNSFDEMSTPPNNYLVWAILSTVLCCLPLGIVSIIKATNVNTLWAQGNYEAAHKSAADAKKFALISAIIMGVMWLLSIVILVIVSFTANEFSEFE